MSLALQLPLNFDADALRRDVDEIPSERWIPHFNAGDYEGGWSVVALYAPTGDAAFILPMQTDHCLLLETPALAHCSYLQEVVGAFDCPKRSVRLLRLHAGATIKPHVDHGLSHADGVVRLHVPIQTNPDVEIYVRDARVEMRTGECWYLDFSRSHRAHNPSAQERIHLVLDCTLNRWLEDQFEQAGFEPPVGEASSGSAP